MIRTFAYDVESLPNFFSITVVSIDNYLKTFIDCCNSKGKPIPLTEKFKVKDIINKLENVNHWSFKITDTNDKDLFPMIEFINGMRTKYDENNKVIRNHWFGYNSSKYDDLMIACLLMYIGISKNTKELIEQLYNTSQKIISLQDDKQMSESDYYLTTLRNYKLPFKSIDVMSVFALNKVGAIIDENGERSYYGKGLKQTSINLKWYQILEYELPPIGEKDFYLYNFGKYKGLTIEQLNRIVDKWQRYIIEDYIPDMMHYNLNDVFIVCEMIRLYIDEIKLRYNISKVYEVDCLSDSRSKIADKLFTKFYSEFSGLVPSQWKGKKTERTRMSFKKVIFDNVKFKTKPLQDLLERMKHIIVSRTGKDAFSEEVKINNLTYTLATGGLHSIDLPRELKASISIETIDSFMGENFWSCMNNDDYIYCHWDISSFYPSLMSVYSIAPEHLDNRTFTKLIGWLKDTRVAAKHSKEPLIDGIPKDILAQALKIVINSIYGKFSYAYGDTYDPMATLKVTINGQLYILMLCEELELNGIEIMSANTDGIVVKLYKNKKNIFENIAKDWQIKTKLSADSEYLRLYICRDVNNYFCQELNGKFEYKGDLNPTLYKNDLSKGFNQPIVGQAVINYFAYNKPVMETLYEAKDILDFCKTQNVGRKFKVQYGDKEIQRNTRFYVSMRGQYIFKVNEDGKKNNLCAGYTVTILNTLDDKSIADRNINYQYYYDEAMKIIDPIKLGISPNQKSNTQRKIKSGKALLKKYAGDYGNLFEDNE